MQRATFTYTNSRNHCLHCVEYAPPPGVRPKAALFLHHGIAEHIERYAPGALFACFVVCGGWDLRLVAGGARARAITGGRGGVVLPLLSTAIPSLSRPAPPASSSSRPSSLVVPSCALGPSLAAARGGGRRAAATVRRCPSLAPIAHAQNRRAARRVAGFAPRPPLPALSRSALPLPLPLARARAPSRTAPSSPPPLNNTNNTNKKQQQNQVFSHWASDHALAVYGYDCHGHGRSGPHGEHERIYVHRFGDLVDDFVDFVGHVTRERLPRVAGEGASGAAAASSSPQPQQPSSSPPSPLPRVLGGHSLGGLVAAHAVLRLAQGSPGNVATPESTGVAGLVLHSAALDVVWTPVLRALAAVGAVLSMLLPRARIVPAVKPEAMHPDPEIVREYLEDPHVVVGNTRARTANEVLRGFKGLAGKEDLFSLPILAVHGAEDTTTSLEAVRRFCARAASAAQGLVRLREVEGGYHELMAAPGEREREAEEVAVWVEGLPEVVRREAAGGGGGKGAGAAGTQQPTSRL